MNINRHNYEEFFILYLDNELSGDKRSEVELFVQANPDLEEEFNMLLQSRFVTDNDVVFENKELLLQSTHEIGITNYEEWLLLYVDNELSPEDRTAVEKFTNDYPPARQELMLLEKCKLPHESIVFPDKESLYRKEETSRRVVALRWTRMAVAAAILFAISISVFLIFSGNNKPHTDGSNAIAHREIKKEGHNPAKTEQVKNNPAPVEIARVEKDQPSDNPARQEGIHHRSEISVKETQADFTVQQELAIANTVDEKNGNNLPVPDLNIKGRLQDNPIAYLPSKDLTNLKEINTGAPVTTEKSPSFIQAVYPESELVQADADRKNSRLRGFFRKVTRTIEKTTNIKATDDEDRLLVAGLAIRL